MTKNTDKEDQNIGENITKDLKKVFRFKQLITNSITITNLKNISD